MRACVVVTFALLALDAASAQVAPKLGAHRLLWMHESTTAAISAVAKSGVTDTSAVLREQLDPATVQAIKDQVAGGLGSILHPTTTPAATPSALPAVLGAGPLRGSRPRSRHLAREGGAQLRGADGSADSAGACVLLQGCESRQARLAHLAQGVLQ